MVRRKDGSLGQKIKSGSYKLTGILQAASAGTLLRVYGQNGQANMDIVDNCFVACKNQGGRGTGLGGTWVARSVKHTTLAQVMISQSVGLSPTSGSVLTARSLEPASDSVSLSLCPSPAHALSLSQK